MQWILNHKFHREFQIWSEHVYEVWLAKKLKDRHNSFIKQLNFILKEEIFERV